MSLRCQLSHQVRSQGCVEQHVAPCTAELDVASQQTLPLVAGCLGDVDGLVVPGFDVELDPVQLGDRPGKCGERLQALAPVPRPRCAGETAYPMVAQGVAASMRWMSAEVEGISIDEELSSSIITSTKEFEITALAAPATLKLLTRNSAPK